MEINENILLGENSYPGIVKKIYNKLEESRGSTIEGDNYLKEMYKTLFEHTSTPMLAIRPYITGSKMFEHSDPNVNGVISFCKDLISKGDMSFLINLAREEHITNLAATHHPAPEKTLESLKESFAQPAGQVIQDLKEGKYDILNSRLLISLKQNFDLPTSEKKLSPIMESLLNMDFKQKGDNLIQYSPVGFMFEDRKSNRIIYLVEHDILTYDKDNDEFINLNEHVNELELTDKHVALMKSINECAYIPKDGVFSLNENWDFTLELHPTGTIFVNKNKEIKKDKVKDLLMESIQFYQKNPGTVKNFNINSFAHDADNFIVLCENADMLIKFDKLYTIRNLNENNYVILDKADVFESHNPRVLSSSKIGKNQTFDSFHKLVESVNEQLVVPVTELFESQLKSEEEENLERNNKVVSLMEEQKLINTHIVEVGRLKNLAEENSPAMTKLTEQENLLNSKLVKNLAELKDLQNLSF